MLLCSGAELNATDAFSAGKSSHEIRYEMWCEAVKRNIPVDISAKHSLDPCNIAALCNNSWSKTREAGFFISPTTAILLEKIKKSGFKLGILTNGPKDIQEIKVSNISSDYTFGYAIQYYFYFTRERYGRVLRCVTIKLSIVCPNTCCFFSKTFSFRVIKNDCCFRMTVEMMKSLEIQILRGSCKPLF